VKKAPHPALKRGSMVFYW